MALFRIGIPTDVDVRKIREAFPDTALTPGTTIPYATICKLIHVADHKQGRYASVTQAWRKAIFRESGILLKAQNGMYTVCDNADKAQLSIDKTKSAARFTRKSIVIGKLVDRNALSEDQLKRFDCAQRYNNSVLALQAVKPKELPPI